MEVILACDGVLEVRKSPVQLRIGEHQADEGGTERPDLTWVWENAH
jgi:hypothetical protein